MTRRKYGIREGMKVEFVEMEDAVLMVPLKGFNELEGADKASEVLGFGAGSF